MKYCIFGGSFDPPHHGHGYLARSACESLNLDKLIWVPSPDPPHKSRPTTSFAHRLAMVKAYAANQPNQTTSDIEAKLSRPSYSIHSIRALKAQYGQEHAWYFLIGSDNWEIFPSWHEHQSVLEEVTLVVFPRSGHPIGQLPKNVLYLNLPSMDLESKQIRKTLEETRDFNAAQVPVEIREYIVRHNLYGMGSST